MAIQRKDIDVNQQGFQEPPDLNEILKQSLGPYYEGVSKGMKEAGYAHAQEAIQSGQQPNAMLAILKGMALGTSNDPMGNFIKMQGQETEKKIDPSLERYRNASSALMEQQYQNQQLDTPTNLVYRDPVTGQEVPEEQAKKDMQEGLGVYQVNQKIVTRSGTQEKNLNKVPDLTQEEKKYVNDARLMGKSLTTLESGFDNLYDKFGKANWQSFQIEKTPYILTQDQDVQNLKSELVYLKAAIPFMRGGKQLTATEAKRVDAMLNPFGKNKETYKKDIQRFQNEFMVGADVMKFGINAPLMKKLISGGVKKEADSAQLQKLGLDPSRYEIVRE